MALTKEQWEASVAQVPPAPEPPAARKITPEALRKEVILSLSATQMEDLLVAIARDDPEAFDRGRFSAL